MFWVSSLDSPSALGPSYTISIWFSSTLFVENGHKAFWKSRLVLCVAYVLFCYKSKSKLYCSTSDDPYFLWIVHFQGKSAALYFNFSFNIILKDSWKRIKIIYAKFAKHFLMESLRRKILSDERSLLKFFNSDTLKSSFCWRRHIALNFFSSSFKRWIITEWIF